MPGQPLSELEIRAALQQLTKDPSEYGFEAYAVARTEPRLRKMALDEKRVDRSDNYKHKVKRMIVEAIEEAYLPPDAEFISGSHVADDQHKIYMIPQVDGYAPFDLFAQPSRAGQFRFDDINDITGLAFELRRDRTAIWAYQHLWSIMIPNKRRSNAMTKIMRMEDVDVIAEQKEPLLTIARKIDLLVLGDMIVTRNIDLMQASFGFQDFIRIMAGRTVERIIQCGITKNPEKLTEYIGRSKSRYARRLMRVSDSVVLQLPPDKILAKVNEVKRWRGSFDIKGQQIVLKNFAQVEDLIDLLDERYTRSDITDKEYDTDVKRLAAPV